jgi:hypothetical protein
MGRYESWPEKQHCYLAFTSSSVSGMAISAGDYAAAGWISNAAGTGARAVEAGLIKDAAGKSDQAVCCRPKRLAGF